MENGIFGVQLKTIQYDLYSFKVDILCCSELGEHIHNVFVEISKHCDLIKYAIAQALDLDIANVGILGRINITGEFFVPVEEEISVPDMSFDMVLENELFHFKRISEYNI